MTTLSSLPVVLYSVLVVSADVTSSHLVSVLRRFCQQGYEIVGFKMTELSQQQQNYLQEKQKDIKVRQKHIPTIRRFMFVIMNHDLSIALQFYNVNFNTLVAVCINYTSFNTLHIVNCHDNIHTYHLFMTTMLTLLSKHFFKIF